MKKEKNSIRFMYLRDPNSRRVITIARQIVDLVEQVVNIETGETVEKSKKRIRFALAINKPSQWKKDYFNDLYHNQGDPFVKDLGRKKAAARLEAFEVASKNTIDGTEDRAPLLAFETDLLDEKRPIETIVNYLNLRPLNKIPNCVQRVANWYVKNPFGERPKTEQSNVEDVPLG